MTGNRRRFPLVLALSLALSLAFGGSAAATTRGTHTQQFWSNFVVSATAFLSAQWTVTSQHSEGQTYWEFSNFWWDTTLSDAKRFQDPPVDSWFHAIKVTFYNASGSQVASFNSGQPSSCGTATAHSTTDVYWDDCRYLSDVPASATKLKVYWSAGYISSTGFANTLGSYTTPYIAIP
jgi:hypothetical protein